MTEREKQQLLRELFAGDETDALRDASLRAGLRAVRWRRRKRLAAGAAVMALPWLLVLFPRPSQAPQPQPMVPSAVVPAPAQGVERINEQQLLALFPNRALALVGKPGRQQLIFLGQ